MRLCWHSSSPKYFIAHARDLGFVCVLFWFGRVSISVECRVCVRVRASLSNNSTQCFSRCTQTQAQPCSDSAFIKTPKFIFGIRRTNHHSTNQLCPSRQYSSAHHTLHALPHPSSLTLRTPYTYKYFRRVRRTFFFHFFISRCVITFSLNLFNDK